MCLSRSGVAIGDGHISIEELPQSLAIGLVLGIVADGFAVSFLVGADRNVEQGFRGLPFAF